MHKNSHPNALIVLIQVQGTEFHINKSMRRVRKFSQLKNFDDVLMRTLAQLLNSPHLVSCRSWIRRCQAQQLSGKGLFCFCIVKLRGQSEILGVRLTSWTAPEPPVSIHLRCANLSSPPVVQAKRFGSGIEV